MVEGRDMMPGTSLALMLDLTKMDQRHERTAHGLNSLAYKLIDQGPVQSSQVTWENLDFKEFSPQLICALTNQIKLTTELEVPAELLLQSEAQVHESTSDLTDSDQFSQSGSTHSVSEPIPIPTMCAFEQNFDLCIRVSPPSDYDWERQFNPPIPAMLSEFSTELSDGQQATSLPLYLIHEEPWLTSTNTKHLWPHTRHQICCNVISRVPTTERYFYAEQPKDLLLLTIVDSMIDICESPQPYIVVENNTELEIVLQNGDRIAKISPIDQEMMLDELEEQAKEQEAQFATHLNQRSKCLSIDCQRTSREIG